MSRTIVIPDANFTANRLDVVELGDIIPCTGLEISQDSIAFTVINATQTITVTKTPADTTQRVYWTSSNENVATVDDGVVTCVGVGSCTITVTCGQQTEICSVTSSVTLTKNDISYTNGLNMYVRSDVDYISHYDDSSKMRTYYLPTNPLNGYRMGASAEKYAGKYPIPIPHNTSNIKITYNYYMNRTYQRWALLNANELASQTSSGDECAKVYAETDEQSQEVIGTTSRYFNISMTNVSSNVNSLALAIGSASREMSNVSDEIEIVFTGT